MLLLIGGISNNARVNRIEPPGIVSYETIDTVIEKLGETLLEVKQYQKTY